MSATKPGLSFLKALGLVVLYIAFITGFTGISMLVAFGLGRELKTGMTLVAIVNSMAMIPTVAVGALICKVRWKVMIQFGPLPWRFVPAVTVMSMGAFLLCSEIENLTRYLLPMPPEVEQLFQGLVDVHANPWAAALALVVVAPLTEELLCRSWVMGSLLGRGQPWRAIVVSAVVFGLMHMNPWQFFYAAVLGVAIGFIYWRTNSLWLCALAHGLNNGLVWFLDFFRPEIPGLSDSIAQDVRFQAWWLDVSALAVFLIGAYWIWVESRDWIAATGESPPPSPLSSPPPLPPTPPPPA